MQGDSNSADDFQGENAPISHRQDSNSRRGPPRDGRRPRENMRGPHMPCYNVPYAQAFDVQLFVKFSEPIVNFTESQVYWILKRFEKQDMNEVIRYIYPMTSVAAVASENIRQLHERPEDNSQFVRSGVLCRYINSRPLRDISFIVCCHKAVGDRIIQATSDSALQFGAQSFLAEISRSRREPEPIVSGAGRLLLRTDFEFHDDTATANTPAHTVVEVQVPCDYTRSVRQLFRLLSLFGPVSAVRASKQKGQMYASFPYEEHAKLAVETLNGVRIFGHELKLVLIGLADIATINDDSEPATPGPFFERFTPDRGNNTIYRRGPERDQAIRDAIAEAPNSLTLRLVGVRAKDCETNAVLSFFPDVAGLEVSVRPPPPSGGGKLRAFVIAQSLEQLFEAVYDFQPYDNGDDPTIQIDTPHRGRAPGQARPPVDEEVDVPQQMKPSAEPHSEELVIQEIQEEVTVDEDQVEPEAE